MRHTRLALSRPVTTVMITLAVLVVGLIAGRLLRLEAMPDITFPGMRIVIPYAGSTPQEMEELVVRPVEEALSTLSGIKEIRASAGSDRAQFDVLFSWDRDVDAAAFDIRTKLDSIRPQLPAGADRMLIFAYSASDQAMVVIRISADRDDRRGEQRDPFRVGAATGPGAQEPCRVDVAAQHSDQHDGKEQEQPRQDRVLDHPGDRRQCHAHTPSPD